MKHITRLTIVATCIAWSATAQQKGNDKVAQDKAAIKSMCGCQEVTFEYTETFPADSSYKPKGYHKIIDAIEYVTVAAEDHHRIVCLLYTSPSPRD